MMVLLLAVGINASLEFSDGGEFKLLQLTDLHFSRNKETNMMTQKLMENLIVIENPDLVILSGDVISGDDWDGTTSKWFENLWHQAVQPMQKYKKPYAMILGNHDRQGYLTPEQIITNDMTYNTSLTTARNYYIDVGKNSRIWMFDSGNNYCNGKRDWGCVDHEAIQWAWNQNVKAHSIAFIHIPIPQILPKLLSNTVGERHESNCHPKTDNGIMDLARKHNIKSIHHGHDHGNDYSGIHDGVMIAYGRVSGYGGYDVDSMIKGARVILLRENSNYPETWIRLANGDKIFQSTLNDVFRKRAHEWILIAIVVMVNAWGLIYYCVKRCYPPKYSKIVESMDL